MSVLRLGTAGAIFVTAYTRNNIGISESIATYINGHWQLKNFRIPAPYPRNRSIAGVIDSKHFGVVGDFKDATRFSYERVASDFTYLADRAAIVRGGSVMAVGVGTITALAGAYAVGFQTRYDGQDQGGRAIALEWVSGDRRELGTGMAFGVDAAGDVVGDDRDDAAHIGHPIAWLGHHRVRISDRAGTAFAIAGGRIVGSLDNGAFVRYLKHRERAMSLDGLANGGWHISSAFAISESGAILAIGSRRSGPERLVLLKPINK